MKKGEQSIGITIAIVIGVILLVLLVFGVTDVWGMFSSQTSMWTEDNSNMDSLINICDLRCSNEDTYAYCSEVREIEINNKAVATGSCYAFADKLSSYEFNKCSRISCSESVGLKDTSGNDLSTEDFKKKVAGTCKEQGGYWVEGKSCGEAESISLTSDTEDGSVCCKS